MKAFLSILGFIIGFIAVFAYVKQPAKCKKIGDDFVDLFQSLSPVELKVKSSGPGDGTTPAPSPATTPTPTPPPAAAAAPVVPGLPTDAIKAWHPPSPFPDQPNWTWVTTDGKTYHNVKIVRMEADCVTIMHNDGGSLVPFTNLPPDVQAQLNFDARAAGQQAAIRKQQADLLGPLRDQTLTPPPANTVLSATAAQSLIGAPLIATDGTEWNFTAKDPAVTYLAVYFSGGWSPPCRAFTPHLVDWYTKFKATHPNFELVFMSEDNTEAEMTDYMKSTAMPWPAVRYGDRGTSGLCKFSSDGVPDLVFVDSSGRVLSDSFQGSTYVGAQQVLADIENKLGH